MECQVTGVTGVTDVAELLNTLNLKDNFSVTLVGCIRHLGCNDAERCNAIVSPSTKENQRRVLNRLTV